MNKIAVLYKKFVRVSELGEYITCNNVYELTYDDWTLVLRKVNTERFDEIMADFKEYSEDIFIIDPIILKSGTTVNISKGDYFVVFVYEIQEEEK